MEQIQEAKNLERAIKGNEIEEVYFSNKTLQRQYGVMHIWLKDGTVIRLWFNEVRIN